MSSLIVGFGFCKSCLMYLAVAAGERAMQSLNGRWFGGRVVSASPVIDAVYASRFPRSRAL